VTVESDGLGKGSRVTVSLPWVPVTSVPTGLVEPDTPLSAAGTTGPAEPGDVPLILAVDDRPTLLLAVQGMLKTSGYRVKTIEDSRVALAQARALRPALMAVDIQMPHVDGLEVIR
jgi:hypothetical protein